jgi:hypothetical protein
MDRQRDPDEGNRVGMIVGEVMVCAPCSTRISHLRGHGASLS